MNGLDLINAERRTHSYRGYDADHDQRHDSGELARAGAAYALDSVPNRYSWSGLIRAAIWPFRRDEFKTESTRLRKLTKAGALIAAEIDRLLAEEEENGATRTESPAAEESYPS